MNNFDAIKLFLNKEGEELQGKNRVNIIILTGILFIAIFGISFGSASLDYLSYKMEDPFINWVDVIADQSVSDKSKSDLKTYLYDGETAKRYLYKNPQVNYTLANYFRHAETLKDVQLEGRSIAVQSEVMNKILEESNVIKKRDIPIVDSDLGIILTEESMRKMGYITPPAFVNLSMSYDEEYCLRLGVTKGIRGYYPIAIPLIAVVKKLPGMYGFIFTNRFLNEMNASSSAALDITSDSNNEKLYIIGNDTESLTKIMQALQSRYENIECRIGSYNQAWEEQSLLEVQSFDTSVNRVELYNQMYNELINNNSQIVRIYQFNTVVNYFESKPAYYSIQMTSLDSIRSFENNLFESCGIKLEMTNIIAKENFRFVQRMGNYLSWLMIAMAVVFICVFIYFLLNSHFQKIQRNLGTFKAFGIDNMTLFSIYMRVLLSMCFCAFAIAFFFSFCLSVALSQFTTIELEYNWINVLVWQNVLLFVCVLVAAMVTTFFVANKRLKQTPGNLIYNRI